MQTTLALDDPRYLIQDWHQLADLPNTEHDQAYLKILESHNFGKLIRPIPLKGRYTKGRRWTEEEFLSCYNAWKNGSPLTLISANLNRNPQDIIYKLLDRCKLDNIEFTQRGRSQNSSSWNTDVAKCAEELFEHGLPAWKISVLFQVDFEFVEKELFVKRKGYGHNKKNPFTINTDHKQLVNSKAISSDTGSISRAIELYAGEGRFTKEIVKLKNLEELVCVENDPHTFDVLSGGFRENSKVKLVFDDNLNFIKNRDIGHFDLIDVDPFVTCHEQIPYAWNLINDNAKLFITFGGEYRRSFIKTNRLSIKSRYGFYDDSIDNSTYLEVVPYYFIGFVAKQAAEHGFRFEITRSVRYANNCRFWLDVYKTEKPNPWLEENVSPSKGGWLFFNHYIPRFKEVRKEIDQANKEASRHE